MVGYCAIAVFPDSRLPSRRWLFAPGALLAPVALLTLAAGATSHDISGYIGPR